MILGIYEKILEKVLKFVKKKKDITCNNIQEQNVDNLIELHSLYLNFFFFILI